MTRLTKSEISAHKEWLIGWRKPADMKSYVENVNDYMGSSDFFNQAGIEFLRDAWVAIEFAVIRGAKLTRLTPGEWPDFEIQLNTQIIQFECTEADEPGRRRGDEYRKAEALAGPDGMLVEDDPVEDWIKRAEMVPEILRAAVEKKVSKRYGSATQLVIYLNISEYGIRQQEIESCFPHACEAGHNRFDAIWILWKKKIYGPFATTQKRIGAA